MDLTFEGENTLESMMVDVGLYQGVLKAISGAVRLSIMALNASECSMQASTF